MTVTTTQRVEAPVEAVWQLLRDLPAMAAFSPEVVELTWTGPRSFTATNRRGDRTWTVPGHLVADEPPHRLRWTVLNPAAPSSTWEYALRPDGDGTLVTHTFAHGPGPSSVRWAVEAEPTRREEIVAGRSRSLAEGMAASLLTAAVAVERGRSG